MPRRNKPRKPYKRTVHPNLPYRSLFEESIADHLKELKVRARYEDEKIPYQIEGKYIPDWTLPNNVIIEAKGFFSAEQRKKMLAVKKANPHRVFCLVFQKASNKILRYSKTTYAEWAEQNGFLWSEGKPDPAWYSLPKGPRGLKSEENKHQRIKAGEAQLKKEKPAEEKKGTTKWTVKLDMR